MGDAEIDRRFRDIEQTIAETAKAVAVVNTLLTTNLSRINELLAEHAKLIRGNGRDAGLLIRVDRLEGHERIRRWMTRTALGAAVTALIGTIARYVFK